MYTPKSNRDNLGMILTWQVPFPTGLLPSSNVPFKYTPPAIRSANVFPPIVYSIPTPCPTNAYAKCSSLNPCPTVVTVKYRDMDNNEHHDPIYEYLQSVVSAIPAMRSSYL